MFTGIIETIGKVESIRRDQDNVTLTIASDISSELKIDQSVSHNGICLTVVEQNNQCHQVTAVNETLLRSNLGDLKVGSLVNLERCLRLADRLDGHLVQGHVDTTGICRKIVDANGSWLFHIEYPDSYSGLLVQKGSVAINGVSLTVIDPLEDRFLVTIIPYTFDHTNFHQLGIGDKVNLEFDLIGKYILKNWHLNQGLVKK